MKRRERPHPKRGEPVFFEDPDTLAKMFTPPNRLNYEEGKYFGEGKESGLKAIEAFGADIKNNLMRWSYEGNSVYYRTKRFWYVYSLRTTNGTEIVECTRFCNTRWTRWDTWMNLHSCTVGSKWLFNEPQKSKWIPLFREG